MTTTTVVRLGSNYHYYISDGRAEIEFILDGPMFKALRHAEYLAMEAVVEKKNAGYSSPAFLREAA